MKFDMFYEVQCPRPWARNHEQQLFEATLEQARMADRLGYEIWWQVEHNATPEFSYSSAPDLWLAAIAQNTRSLRIGHSGIIGRHRVNHPVRTAARTATLDIVSNGRLEVGLAVSGGREWATYGADPTTSAAEYQEYFEMLPRIWTDDKFRWESQHITVPPREVVPRPLQKPHPPLWQTAGSPPSFRAAGRRGVGLLALTIFSPIASLKAMLDEYEAGLAECKAPVGKFANKQKAVFTFIHVAESRKRAIESGAAWSALWYVLEGPKSFMVPLNAYFAVFGSGENVRSESGSDKYKLGLLKDGEPDPTNLEPEPHDNGVVALVKRMARGEPVSNEEAHEELEKLESVVIGDPDHCIAKLREYERIGTDRMMCLMQFGRIGHEAIVRSMRLTSEAVIPAFR